MLTFYLSLIEDHQYDSKFERVYTKYEKLMFAVTLEVTKNFYDAEEALDDAFIIVAKKIADIREDNDLKQSDIAKILETTQQQIHKYETGKQMMGIDKYIKLARYYNISLDYLTGLTDIPKPLENNK